jgi:hypothetical protein
MLVSMSCLFHDLDEMVALGDDPLLPNQAVPARVHHLTLLVLQVDGT